VADTGIGIEPEVVQRLFFPFEQGNGSITRQFGGLGLGLSICRAMVHAHGGVLSAASDGPDRGSTFSVRLPAVAPPASAPATPSLPEVPEEAPPSGLRVLLVEDHPDTSYVMGRILTRMGYAVTPTAGVPEALRAVEAACAAGEPFDLLLSDLSLPDGSGHDLLRDMRQICGWDVPAVSVSGFGMEEDLRRSREAGFAVHLTKPVTLEQLEGALRTTLCGLATGERRRADSVPEAVPAGG
jgi:CheY-like chemotaxis protein